MIQLVVMRHQVHGYTWSDQSEAVGTAFLTSAEGRAITNSHVIELAWRTPATYRLLAIVGSEFYSARVICSSVLPATVNGRVTFSRDVAGIQLTPSEFGFEEVTFRGIGRARVHRGGLPAFVAVTFGDVPAPGDSVRVLGYGRQENAILPYEWSAGGTVGTRGHAPDGTPLFTIRFDREAEPGHSGSPVLNMKGQVVGMLTWLGGSDSKVGVAISRPALEPACPG